MKTQSQQIMAVIQRNPTPTKTVEELREELNQLKQKRSLIANYDVRKNYKKSFQTEFSAAIRPHVKEYKNQLELAKHFAFIDSMFEVVLTKILNETEAKKIVDEFRACVKNEAFHHMLSVYSSYKDNLEMRNLIKFCSSLYRFKYFEFTKKRHYVYYHQCKAKFKSEMKYASACESCGKLAFGAAVLFKRLGFVNDL
jgi:hydroxymethylpyrimidine pyrophosphatase-like HAD family hydrolase